MRPRPRILSGSELGEGVPREWPESSPSQAKKVASAKQLPPSTCLPTWHWQGPRSFLSTSTHKVTRPAELGSRGPKGLTFPISSKAECSGPEPANPPPFRTSAAFPAHFISRSRSMRAKPEGREFPASRSPGMTATANWITSSSTAPPVLAP